MEDRYECVEKIINDLGFFILIESEISNQETCS